ncbi:hypothetical protein CVT24_002189 [Panaeolus cyanescens]|uniref:Amino acid permease/ SLC12A domain-containing protein n=1 Tax=Panaeolus cyanescens TaxID=181874 RepID=A0A409YHY5_9AGAR|nr:hypothetical protein CVT24_002189 [Panaeolus cyanescens]
MVKLWNETTHSTSHPVMTAEGSASRQRLAPVLGAPEEQINPLGRHVTLLSAIMLNIGQMMGFVFRMLTPTGNYPWLIKNAQRRSGIYAVPGVMLNSVGSIGLLLVYWIVAPFFAFAGLSLYTEFASLFPRRSGGEVAYLEQAYPHPRFLVSTAFAATAILMSFSATNAIIFSQYLLSALDIPISNRNQTLVAISVVFITSGGVALSTKWSLRAVNALTVVKMASMSFMAITGVFVLLGLTPVRNPYDNFLHPFKGSTWNLNSHAVAFIKSNHSFIGWHNAFYLVGEIKDKNPIYTARKSGRLALFLVAILFLLVNVAYVAAVPYEELKASGSLVAVKFFHNVYGSRSARFLPLLVSMSCFGNMARVIREVARQGLLPYPTFFASTKPFGTPIGPIGLRGTLTMLVILVLPAQDAFNFMVDLASYPTMFFQTMLSLGIWKIRSKMRSSGISPSPFQARNGIIIVYLTSCILLLLLPWVPPPPGHADVSFWYATYCVVGIALLLVCGLYYWTWIVFLPRLGGYEIVEEVERGADGAQNTKLVRRYNAQNQHDETQSLLRTTA